MKTISPLAERTDLELLALARTGDRDAYGRLVSRHQTLVASLAYSICGDFTRSQDIAQEAFINAWQQLTSLEEAAKFKAWLCGITRNLANNFVRQQTRRPDGPSGSLAVAAPESTDGAPDPHERAVTREESAIVWGALEQLPETFREPLILFYREHQSVERVAAALDLSEDTVKQRLSRGRSMLRDRVESLIERSLGFTTPGVLFTTTLLSALPVVTAQIAATTLAGAAAKSSAASKTAGALPWLASLLNPLLAIPLVSLFGTALQSFFLGKSIRAPEERKFMQRLTWSTGIISTIAISGIVGIGWWNFRHRPFPLSPMAFDLILLGLFGIGVIGPIFIYFRNSRHLLDTVRNCEPPENASRWRKKLFFGARRVYHYRSQAAAFGLPLIDIRFGHSADEPLARGTAVGWIALGDRAHGVVFALGGFAVAGIAIGGIAIGPISMGAVALGLIAFGGVAMGGLANGIVFSLGYFALGPIVVAWESAQAIAAIAQHTAKGWIFFALQTGAPAARHWELIHPLIGPFEAPNVI